MQARRLLFVLVGVAAMIGSSHLAEADPYLVRPGDTLSQVAARLGVSVRELAAANGLADPDFIVAGHVLVVPSDGGSATEYVVGPGETLSEVAQRVDVPLAQLAAVNGVTDPDRVLAGRLLAIPPVGPSAASPSYAPSTTGSYVVGVGDALSDIALELGVPLGQLAAANGITDPDLVPVGQVLTVPNAWVCPVPGGTFVNDYGYVRPDGSGQHRGVDLFAERGTPVLAPVGGTAEWYPNNSGGKAVQLYGRDGNRYYFAHLDDYGEKGQVTTGSVIGYVGNTGDARATSPHLHFEIHPDGGADTISPFPSLVAACR